MAFSFTQNKLVIIGGSAGSMDPVLKLLSSLPAQFGAVVLLVVHRQRNVPSRLDELLTIHTKSRITEPEDKEALVPGHIYLAPQNYHLLLEAEGNFALEYSEPVCFSRPSIDVTLQSAALLNADKNLLAILLSGANADGAEGLAAVLAAGGTALVQSPESAEFPAMPAAALARNPAIKPLPVATISGKLTNLVL